MIVAFLLITAGAALMAFAIFCAVVIFGAAGFAVSDGDAILCCAFKTDDTRKATAANVRTIYLRMAHLSPAIEIPSQIDGATKLGSTAASVKIRCRTTHA